MKIKRWALLTVVLYLLTLFVLTGPAVLACFSDSTSPPTWSDVGESYKEFFKLWESWLAVGLLGVVQFVFLLTPLEVARQRPVSRARWIWLAVTAGLMMAALIIAAGITFFEIIHMSLPDDDVVWKWPAAGGMAWLISGVTFYFYGRSGDDSSRLARTVDRLLTGSVAELLIAVPCHVYVRHQKYCCAGWGTFTGIATGLSVMLFAFGPGVFFLFVKRARRLQRAQDGVPDSLPDPQPNQTEINVETKDAGFWALAGVAILLVPATIQLFQQSLPAEFILMGRAGFIVMGCVSFFHGVRGYRAKQRHNRWMIFAGAALVEAVSLVAWWTFR